MSHFVLPSMRSLRLLAGGVVVLAVAAFLVWGPPGLGSGSPRGNGPLFIGSYGADGVAGPAWQRQGIIIPIHSSSHSTVVIDKIRLIGGAGYPAPRSFALRVFTYTQCGGAMPLRRTPHGYALPGCLAHDVRPRIGRGVHWSGGGTAEETEAVVEVSPPKRHSCWVLMGLVVRYHIADQRYRATYPDTVVGCRGLSDEQEQVVFQEAMDAAYPT